MNFRKISAMAGVAVLCAVGFVAGPSAVEASAARQHNFEHLHKSEVGSVLVYYDFHCKGPSYDMVPRDSEAEIDVGSVWLTKGHSLWSFNRRATFGTLYAASRSRSRCVSMSVQPGTNFYAAIYNGQRRGPG